MNATILILSALTLGAWPAASVAGDAAAGAAIAREACARCHDVSPEGAFKTYPPSFASIAVFRSEEQIRSRILFPVLHAPMPQGAGWYSPEELDDLVAYILSLERPAP